MYVIDKKSEKLIQVAHCNGRFWQMNFEIPASEVKPSERETHLIKSEHKKGGSSTMRIHDSILKLPQIWNFSESSGIALEVENPSDTGMEHENLGGTILQ